MPSSVTETPVTPPPPGTAFYHKRTIRRWLRLFIFYSLVTLLTGAVSVLFADLVGFTTASEGRDAEDTRELLTRYFDSSRQIVERYGGTVEKFIGDAVMAVWGAPVAQEDDAERAVRAALDLVSGVSMLGQEVGAPDLPASAIPGDLDVQETAARPEIRVLEAAGEGRLQR